MIVYFINYSTFILLLSYIDCAVGKIFSLSFLMTLCDVVAEHLHKAVVAGRVGSSNVTYIHTHVVAAMWCTH